MKKKIKKLTAVGTPEFFISACGSGPRAAVLVGEGRIDWSKQPRFCVRTGGPLAVRQLRS